MSVPDAELTRLREEIDLCDRELLRVLASRLAVVRRIAERKIAIGHDLWDENRVRQILDERSKWAQEAGLDPAWIADFFRNLIEHNVQLEQAMLLRRRNP